MALRRDNQGTLGQPGATAIGAEQTESELALEGSNSKYASQSDAASPPADNILVFCGVISILDCFALATASAACLWSIVTALGSFAVSETKTLAGLILRGNAIAMCLLLGLEQLSRYSCFSCHCMKRLFPMLDYWIGRGLLHVLIAMEMEGANIKDEDKNVSIFVTVASLTVFGLGGFFIAGGFLCFGPIERRQRRKASRNDELRRELAVVEERKRKLEGEIGLV